MTTKAKTATPKIDTKQIDEAVAVGKQTVEQAVAVTKEQVENAVVATKEQVEKASAAALKGYDELALINKDGIDAFVKSGNVVAKAAEEFGKSYFAFAQAAAEQNVEAAKALMGAKTLNDVVEIQTDLARTSFDKFVAEGTKLSEMTVKVTNDAFEPLQAHANVVVEKMMKPVAA